MKIALTALLLCLLPMAVPAQTSTNENQSSITEVSAPTNLTAEVSDALKASDSDWKFDWLFEVGGLVTHENVKEVYPSTGKIAVGFSKKYEGNCEVKVRGRFDYRAFFPPLINKIKDLSTERAQESIEDQIRIATAGAISRATGQPVDPSAVVLSPAQSATAHTLAQEYVNGRINTEAQLETFVRNAQLEINGCYSIGGHRVDLLVGKADSVFFDSYSISNFKNAQKTVRMTVNLVTSVKDGRVKVVDAYAQGGVDQYNIETPRADVVGVVDAYLNPQGGEINFMAFGINDYQGGLIIKSANAADGSKARRTIVAGGHKRNYSNYLHVRHDYFFGGPKDPVISGSLNYERLSGLNSAIFRSSVSASDRINTNRNFVTKYIPLVNRLGEITVAAQNYYRSGSADLSKPRFNVTMATIKKEIGWFAPYIGYSRGLSAGSKADHLVFAGFTLTFSGPKK